MSIIEIVKARENPLLNNWLSDDDLFFKRLKSHDLEAFKSLYKIYASSLLGTILRVVKDERKSEQILEKTFIEVWNTIGIFDEKKHKLFVWMNQISRRFLQEVG